MLEFFDLRPFDVPGVIAFGLFFIVVWQIAAKHFFGPFIELYEEREAATTGAEDSAATVIEEAAQLEKDYDSAIASARVAALEEKFERVAHAEKKASEKIHAAETEAKALLDKARAEAESEAQALRSALDSEISGLVSQVKEKITQTGAGA